MNVERMANKNLSTKIAEIEKQTRIFFASTAKRLFSLFAALTFSFLVSGCKLGGNVTGQLSQPTPVAIISAPIITSHSSPWVTNTNSITISGVCTSGAMIYLNGASTDHQLCLASAFSFTVTQSSDGTANYFITQSLTSQPPSNAAVMTWTRRTSIAPPIVSQPSASPYLSALGSITVAGFCETGARVTVSDGTTNSVSTTCAASTYSLVLNEAADANYNLSVTQAIVDSGGTPIVSNSTNLQWNKQALTATPTNPFLIVNTNQVLTITGGSGIYTVMVTQNSSGCSFDPGTNTYTAGTTANATDILTILDSQQVSTTIQVTTVAGPADHLVLPTNSGSAQSTLVGQLATRPLTVKVVDQYGNGIPAIPLLFNIIVGDASITSQPIVVSDAYGQAQINFRVGYQTLTNMISVAPLSGALPATATNSSGSLIVSEKAITAGNGQLGTSFSVGLNPGPIVMADFNGDGYLDAAVLNEGDPSIGILLGKGNGLFRTMTTVRPICTGPTAMVQADINNDNQTDLIVVCNSANKIAVMLGNGDGTFTAARSSPFATGTNESSPLAVAVGDFNRDGILDLAVTSSGNNLVGIWRGVGDGTFLTPGSTYEFSVGITPNSIAVGDFDNDGKTDLVVANSSSNDLSVLINNGNGTFKTQVTYATGANPVAVVVADLNGDGYLDIADVENSGFVSAFLNDQTGLFQLSSSTSVGASPSSLTVGDFNGDHIPDLAVAANGDNAIDILLGADSGSGKGTGAFVLDSAVATSNGPIFITTVDANRDNSLDLIVSGNTDQVVQIIPGHGNGTFGFNQAVGTNPLASASADFDGDGKLDLAVVNSGANTVSILTGNGKGLFTALSPLSTANTPVAIIAADLNLDSKMDLVVVNQTSSSVQIFLGNGDGTFNTPTSVTVGNGPNSVVAKDFNNDGYLDLAVVDGSISKISILKNAGNGSFTYNPVTNSYATGNGPMAIIADDLNLDKKVDLAVVNQTDSTVSVFLGNGDGTFQAQVTYATGNGPSAIATADIDGDSKLDLVTANSVDNSVSILIGDGIGQFASHVDYTAGSSVNGLAVGDLNNDGYPDLIVPSGSNQQFTVLSGSRTAQYNSQKTYTLGGAASGLSLGDFNADGSLDLLFFDTTNNLVEVWMGH